MSQIAQIQTLFNQIDAAPTSTVTANQVAEGIASLEPTAEALEIAIPELIAFNLVEVTGTGIASVGKLYCPKIEGVNPDGTSFQLPDMSRITPDMISFWEQRYHQSQHPFLKHRYAGLVFDLTAPVTGNPPPHALRIAYMETGISLVANNQFEHPYVRVVHLIRLVKLAIQYNDAPRFNQLKELAIRLEQELHEQRPPGTWGFIYDHIYQHNQKFAMTAEEEAAMVQRLEDKITLYGSTDQNGRTDPWGVREAAARLSKYYERTKRPEDAKRVVMAVGAAFEQLFDHSSPMQIAGWLRQLYELYVYNKLNTEADEILLRYREVAKQIPGDIGTIAHQVQLPKEEVDAFVDSLFTSGEGFFPNVIDQFTPNKELAEEQIKEMARHAPLSFSATVEIVDTKGRLTATVGPISTDLDGRTMLRIAENVEFNSAFLLLALEEGAKRDIFTQQSVMELLAKSDVIEPERLAVLEAAVGYYFKEDWMVFLHLAIPQIEEAFRNLVELRGGKILRVKDGKFMLKTFDDILNDDLIKDTLKEDFQSYLRLLFTDPRGLNLRNIINHGLEGPHFFNPLAACRVMHILLTLGFIRFQPAAEDPSAQQNNENAPRD